MASAKYQSILNKSDMHNVRMWKTKQLIAILEFVLYSENSLLCLKSFENSHVGGKAI